MSVVTIGEFVNNYDVLTWSEDQRIALTLPRIIYIYVSFCDLVVLLEYITSYSINRQYVPQLMAEFGERVTLEGGARR